MTLHHGAATRKKARKLAGLTGLAGLLLAAVSPWTAIASSIPLATEIPLPPLLLTSHGTASMNPVPQERLASLQQSSPIPESTPIDRSVFGSVAIPVSKLAADVRWRRLLDTSQKGDPIRCLGGADADCQSGKWAGWRNVLARAKHSSGVSQLALVNREVNKLIQHTADLRNYGNSDYWADLDETVARGRGDCEDFAIAKMRVLQALGIPLAQMQLVVLRDKERGTAHAVLAVPLDGTTYILDNQMAAVKPSEQLTFYQAVYSISTAGRWLHGVRVKSDKTASIGANEPAATPSSDNADLLLASLPGGAPR